MINFRKIILESFEKENSKQEKTNLSAKDRELFLSLYAHRAYTVMKKKKLSPNNKKRVTDYDLAFDEELDQIVKEYINHLRRKYNIRTNEETFWRKIEGFAKKDPEFGVMFPNYRKMVTQSHPIAGYRFNPEKERYEKIPRWKKEIDYSTHNDSEESLNESSDHYEEKHPRSNAHSQSLARTVGSGQTQRKSQNMVAAIRKNPNYTIPILNRAESQKGSRFLLDAKTMQEITDVYGINWDDRRIKTIKGKTGIYLEPTPQGWFVVHR